MIQLADTLIDQLRFFHREIDIHQTHNLSDEAIDNYFRILLGKNRLIFHIEAGRVVGYVESWRVNYAQLGWILCNRHLDIGRQDIESGNICYVANVAILPEYRQSEVVRVLKTAFVRQNFACDYFVGNARRKKHEPFKVFTRTDFIKRFSSEGVMQGDGRQGG